jgi:hypothetical protein
MAALASERRLLILVTAAMTLMMRAAMRVEAARILAEQ